MKLKEHILPYLIFTLFTYAGIGFLKQDFNILNFNKIQIAITVASSICAYVWYELFLLIIKIRKQK